MASSSAPVHPARYLSVFLLLVIGVYLLVFLTGDKRAAPKLGIDLQGGTRVTLTARTPDGSRPSREALAQAQQIISARVNGLGVSGSEVVVDGDNLVITVPGTDGSEARNLGQTARLYIRPVLNSMPAQPAPPKDLADRIAEEKGWRQSTRQGIQFLGLQFQATQCNKDDILAGNDDPALPLITCSTDHKVAYLLAPSIISGDQIENASSTMNQRGIGYVVDVQFRQAAANTWADFTAAHVGTQTAFTLDSQVVSAPMIQEAIPGGRTQITGGDPPFTASTARQLANVLKYGSLPLSFESSEAQTVSATLGLTSLKAGLVAGAIGLVLVLVYSLVYYRVLGLLTALSLVASGAMVFAILVLLGRYINYTLDLAGIAGLIIGIGTTADSFVVFFERIKDEIREGRSFRSAVPRGWVRARKTIVSGNAVTFLAAAVLYFLAIGQVKGFAFTLGLTTILDLVVVFLVTWPLVYLASKSPTLAKPAYNGLGAVQRVARERRAAAHVQTGRG
ncbi:protein translocase subunit SecD [Mycobacterium sp. 852002-51057_SCH5723018]|uniref:protein translocase subunit SecD n=1 Tax=Mycobacterium sp. 852002-51057_SCH5723018 TaxID=1834094 RepID=UPI000801535A|nr:protein translocase subunit SecD [Mycobacterium sp. 852002-51057_SCH5723018]OBG25241.1 protein-export membrane protein SecD [Mycobacterium sp. 852002-51057_SCH5723018]